MKRLLIATNLLTLSVIFLQGCLFNTTSVNPSKIICSDYSTDEFIGLDKALVQNMVWNYKWNHLPRDNMWINQANATSVPGWNTLRVTTGNESDARSIMFDLDRLKKFLWQLEYTAIQNGLDRSKLGVRIYYAEYPDSVQNMSEGVAFNKSYRNKVWGDFQDLFGLPTNYKRRHTLVFIPTYLNANDFPVDFDPRHVVAGQPVPLREIFAEQSIYGKETRAFVFPDYSNFRIAQQTGDIIDAGEAANTVSGSSSTRALNHGSLVPPPAAGASGANLLDEVDQ